MQIGYCTNVGAVREVNEDALFISSKKNFPIFIVADGMGGHNAGEIASGIVVKVAKEFEDDFFRKKLKIEDVEIPKIINELFQEANIRIYNEAINEKKFAGMGTTASLILIDKKEYYIGHVGDSRIYAIDDNMAVSQLTKDHSVVAEMLRNGKITAEEAFNHPQKNLITRALGVEEKINVDILNNSLENFKYFVLCSDGLSNLVRENEMIDIIQKSKNVQIACENMIELANKNGGNDNITVVLIQVY